MSLPSCRILTISSSLDQAKRLAQRIIVLSSSAAEETSPQIEEDGSGRLPWTISNKYYTAPVHFSFVQTREVTLQDAAQVPACIFVFSPTEIFKDEFNSLISRLEGSDFEVSIAVSVPMEGANPPTVDEDDAFEAYFGDHGFEYINGNTKNDLTQEQDVDEMEGVPGIGRIIDALSTILWPSMVQMSGSKRAKTRSMVSVPGPPGEEEGLQSLLDDADKQTSENSAALQHEMAELERWLEEGADNGKDPWMTRQQSQFGTESSAFVDPPPAESGFDDNFSDFVSAPAQAHADTEIDPSFPSQEEISLMSRRIHELAMSEDPVEGSEAPFDLSGVLAALDVMKEEIAGITDEDEKRKAAAKVALGLVYGLGG